MDTYICKPLPLSTESNRQSMKQLIEHLMWGTVLTTAIAVPILAIGILIQYSI